MFKRYLFSSFAYTFFPFFIVLFFVSSVVLLITIAGSSFVVRLSFWDLLQLFLFSLPNTIFFIIPITFFAASVLSISRLSYDYELLVFFSLGIKPFEIIKVFLPITLIVTLTALVFSLGAVPVSKRAFDNFIAQKKVDVDVNIKSGEFGQKIGDWLVYVDRAENRNYDNMVLFSVNGVAMENFISAQSGSITNQAGVFSLNLHNGASYVAESDEFKKVVFNQMNIRTQVGEAPLSGYDLIEYWSGAFDGSSATAKRRFAKAILVSIFPLVSVFLIPLIGVANPRFHKNFSYFYVIGATLLYYVLVHILAGEAPFVALFAIPTLWWIGTYWLYHKQIKSIY